MSTHRSTNGLLLVVACCATVFGLGLQTTVNAETVGAVSASANPQNPPTADRYYIEFRSRYAQSYGHSFVVFGPGTGPGKKISPNQIAGLHPAGNSAVPWLLGHVMPVISETGASEGDTDAIYVSARYHVALNKAQYVELVAFIRRLQASSPVWQAEAYNCNAFVADIAKHLGLKTPTSMIFPKEFITQLRELNSGSLHTATAVSSRQ